MENSRRKIYVVSPSAPSGVTWLANCFIELGVLTHLTYNKRDIWIKEKQNHILNPRSDYLRKWLPALDHNKEFKFREDIEVFFSHEWPTQKFDHQQVIFFIRDPRDAILSDYRRRGTGGTFNEFIKRLGPYTLLNQIDQWILYVNSWMVHENVRFFRFEDYKSNAKSLLTQVLDYIQIEVDDELVTEAIINSSFEKAAEAEKRYREQQKEKQYFEKNDFVFNRASTVGEWQHDDKVIEVVEEIERRTGRILTRFGYSSSLKEDVPYKPDFSSHVKLLSFFNDIRLDPLIHENQIKSAFFESEVIKFAKDYNDEYIRNHKISFFEVEATIASLREYLSKLGGLEKEPLPIIERAHYVRALDTPVLSFFMNNKKARVLIFGTGRGGEITINAIDKFNEDFQGEIEIIGFADNNNTKWGNEFFNKMIYDPKQMNHGSFDIILIASIAYEEIKKQLENMGIQNDSILPALEWL